MLFLLNKCFDENNYDIVFNTNLDDYYHPKRFISQINEISNGSLLNSTMWTYITQKSDTEEIDILKNDGKVNRIIYENNNFNWIISNNMDDYQYNGRINYESIKENLLSMNNIINHSGVCFTKKFWNSTDIHNNYLRYRYDKPYEDLSLWYRAIQNNIHISIINDNLIYYRIHDSQIGSQLIKISNNQIKLKTFSKEPNLIDIQISLVFDINLKNIYKINSIYRNILPDKKKYLFLYIPVNEKIYIEQYLLMFDQYEYILHCYDKEYKEDDYIEILKIFDMQFLLNSDYTFVIKNLNYKYNINELNNNNTIVNNDNYISGKSVILLS
jgi:hypothetical protein